MKRIKVQSMASGDSFSIPVYDFKGTKKGAKSVYLQSAMHGSEVQGSFVLAKLIQFLEKNPPLGNVRIIPNANPAGLNQKAGEYTFGRFDLSTGDNFNRQYFLVTRDMDWSRWKKYRAEDELFRDFRAFLKKSIQARSNQPHSYSESLALKLQTLSIDYDLCLDLHCANQSVRHCYVPAYAKDDAAYFNIPFHILMPNKFGGAMDEVFFNPWWTLAEQIHCSIPVQSFTLELGNHELASESQSLKDLDGILNYLRHMGVVSGRAKKVKAPVRCEQKNYKVVYAPVGGITDWIAPLGKKVRKGQLLAKILYFAKTPVEVPILSPVDGIPILNHSSAVVNQGAELVKLFSQA